MSYLVNFRKSIFETLALQSYRHSPEILRLVSERRRAQDDSAAAEAGWVCYNFNQDSFVSAVTSCGAFTLNQTNLAPAAPSGGGVIFNQTSLALADASWVGCNFDLSSHTSGQFSFFTSTSADTLAFSSNFAQISSVDSYRALFRAAVDGKALNTFFQFQNFLNFLDIDLTLERTRSLFDIDIGINQQAITDFVICNGERRLSWQDIHAIWADVDAQLSLTGRFESGFEVAQYVREQISTKPSLPTPCVVVSHKKVALPWVPSTHEWVHSFVLPTGVSPPVEGSDMDANRVRNAQRPKTAEHYRDFLFGQENRPRRPRIGRTRGSKPSSKTGCSTARYLVGRVKLGRGPFRRTRSYRQDDRYQAA
jgi:hypothetical protein